MEEPAFVQKNEQTFQRNQVLERRNTKQRGNVVSTWKNKPSAFQNTKNLWYRCIIRDVRRTFVLKLIMPANMCASHTREMTPKLDFNTKILLTSRMMHRFQRFLVFWKAEGLLFHLETTFPRCFVFVRSRTGHLWKFCSIYWTNAGSSIPVLVKYLSQTTGNTENER